MHEHEHEHVMMHGGEVADDLNLSRLTLEKCHAYKPSRSKRVSLSRVSSRVSLSYLFSQPNTIAKYGVRRRRSIGTPMLTLSALGCHAQTEVCGDGSDFPQMWGLYSPESIL